MNDRKLLIAGGVVVALLILAGALYFLQGEDLASKAKSDNPKDRLAAAEGLGERSDAESVSTLKDLTRSDNLRVAVRAVQSLGEKRSKEKRRILEEIVRSEKRGKVAGEAAATLGNYDDLQPKVLTAVLNSPQADAEARAGAAKGLSRLRKKESVPSLVAALTDPDPKVRLWAITAIYQTTKMRFLFNASKPPSTQSQRIEFIRSELKHQGFL
ncbi:MAG: HEAT repeat domain-containing protein [Phycisphaerae bacterium]